MRLRSRRTRQWPASRQLLLGVLLALIAVFGLTEAAASQINLGPGGSRPVTAKWARCSGNQLTVTITGSTAAVSGLNASACSGKTLRLFVRSGTSTLTTSAAISGATASLTLPSAVTTAAGVAATIGTWAVPVTWSVVTPTLPAFGCSIPSSPTVPCTVTLTKDEGWTEGGLQVWQKSIQLTTTSTQPVAWRLVINLSHSSFPFVAKRLHSTDGHAVFQSTSGCTATPRTVTVTGRQDWGQDTISATKSVTLQLRGDSVGSGGNLLNCP